MNTTTLNFAVINSNNTKFSDAQIFLQEFTGQKFSRDEAEKVWSKILDHKWNLSERLNRDVGLRVASIDYIEHFYHPALRKDKKGAITKSFRNTLKSVTNGFREYFEMKGKHTPFV